MVMQILPWMLCRANGVFKEEGKGGKAKSAQNGSAFALKQED